MAKDLLNKGPGRDEGGSPSLDEALLDEHAGDADPARLAELYGEAAAGHKAAGDIEAACFFFTHAFVFALEAGDEELVSRYRASLIRHGREEPEWG